MDQPSFKELHKLQSTMRITMEKTFSIKPLPSLRFGVNSVRELPDSVLRFGRRVLVVIGASSITTAEAWPLLLDEMTEKGISFETVQISGEPTPEIVDTIAERNRPKELDVVVSIGGGSVLDGGKAISAMLAAEGSVKEYLEGVGKKEPTGEKVPFIAVPTTSGTGSEMTSNAVISSIGEHGFKKSLRHDSYIPDLAIVDPSLTSGCPRDITLNCAMDAFTQLVESYLSTGASPFTDDLAFGAIARMAEPLKNIGSALPTLEDRIHLSYAANISGITLANAGLGVVHGFASVIGGLWDIPHGVVCGTLMASSNELTLAKLRKQQNKTQGISIALEKYARLGKLFCNLVNKNSDYYQEYFIERLHQLTADFQIKSLSAYGVSRESLQNIASQTGNKNNPVTLNNSELVMILEKRM